MLLDKSKTEWDLYMPYIAMGYRMSKQAAVGYSPYCLLYGRHPIFMSRIQLLEDTSFPDLDDGEALGLFLNERGQVIWEVMPLAMRNLAIAQNRDRTQYKRVRGSGWDRPKPRFKVGECVLVGRQTKGKLDIATHTEVLQVTEVKGNGLLELQGSDGVRICEQVKNAAHCSVPVLDPSVDTGLVDRVDPIHHHECGKRSDAPRMVLCDVCNVGYHIWCVTPSFDNVPEGRWTCQRHAVG